MLELKREIPEMASVDFRNKDEFNALKEYLKQNTRLGSIQNQFIDRPIEEIENELKIYNDSFFERLNNLSSLDAVPLNSEISRVLILKIEILNLPKVGTADFVKFEDALEESLKDRIGDYYFNFLEIVVCEGYSLVAIEYYGSELDLEDITRSGAVIPIELYHKATGQIAIPFHLYKYFKDKAFSSDLELYFFVKTLENQECSCCDDKISEPEFTRYKY